MSTTRKTVLILPPLQIHDAARRLLESEVEVVDGADLDAEGVAAALASTHGLVGAVSGDQIRAAPNLEVIGIPGSGWDMIDVPAATAAGVLVVNAAGAQHAAVAEHGIGLMLSLAKRIAYSDRIFHAEKRFVGREHFMGDGWPGWAHELSGSTVGIVGFGVHRPRPRPQVPARVRHDGAHVRPVLRPRRGPAHGRPPDRAHSPSSSRSATT